MLPRPYVEGAGLFLWNVFTSKNIIPGYLYRFNNNTAAYESVLNHRLGTVPVNRRILIFL
jgi:hypothetical protein